MTDSLVVRLSCTTSAVYWAEALQSPRASWGSKAPRSHCGGAYRRELSSLRDRRYSLLATLATFAERLCSKPNIFHFVQELAPIPLRYRKACCDWSVSLVIRRCSQIHQCISGVGNGTLYALNNIFPTFCSTIRARFRCESWCEVQIGR